MISVESNGAILDPVDDISSPDEFRAKIEIPTSYYIEISIQTRHALTNIHVIVKSKFQ